MSIVSEGMLTVPTQHGGVSASDEWELDRLKIEMGQKLGGELHDEVYKGTYLKTGQSVTVKTFRVSKQMGV